MPKKSIISSRGFRAALLWGSALAHLVVAAESAAAKDVSFARDIRPILQNHCWSCHGADAKTREAGLRLDLREAAIERRGDAEPAIIPGDAAGSLLVRRIDAAEEEERMPPASTKKPLSAEQRQLLRDWIASGAEYSAHWAFRPPQSPAIPEVQQKDWPRHPIDQFVLARLEAAGLSPSPEAAPETLLRRVTLDLTGLPPSVEELDDFLNDASPDAYERAVDRLLASPRHAERLAAHWLDLARYADSNGYNNDEERTMWPWRDWVINAFRENLPYDRFLMEQLAGDLLPDATTAQRIATGFNRNHVLTTEGGIIEEEYRVEYVADRVHTTASVFLGLSMQCARCHDHKYDPITQREFYQFAAYFNRLPDTGVGYNQGGVSPPFVKAPSAEQERQLAELTRRDAELAVLLTQRRKKASELAARWEAELPAADREKLKTLGPRHRFLMDETAGDALSDAIEPARRAVIHGKPSWVSGKQAGALAFDGQTYADMGDLAGFDSSDRFSFAFWITLATKEPSAALSRMDDAAAFRGYDIILEGGKVAVHLVDHWPDNGLKVITRDPLPLNEWRHLVVSYDGSKKAAGVRIFVDGKPQPLDVSSDRLTGTLKTPKPFHLGRRQSSAPFRGALDDLQIFAVELSAEEAARLAEGQSVHRIGESLRIPRDERAPEQNAEIERVFFEQFDAESIAWTAEQKAIPGRRAELEKQIPSVMVMQDTVARATHLLKRGQYDQPGEVVSPNVPAALSPFPDGAPQNRLGLARWLVSPGHPLTARIAVNRYWELCFGAGLVETSEDFGVTGALPSHPELLDWLALRFQRGDDAGGAEGGGNGWDIRRLIRSIVTSATYRQSSHFSALLRDRDPKNVLLSRAPRLRLSAEAVRDSALAVSGLLVERSGGPSVKPYQPEGLWEEVSVERRYKYVPDVGEGLYRRTMYTFWKRTCPPPALSTFDAPTRETCTIRRARTNTPLQALVLLNDPTYIETARRLAERALATAPASTEGRIEWMFRRTLSRRPSPEETEAIRDLFGEALRKFEKAPAEAERLLGVGQSRWDARHTAPELASWTIVATTLLNLDAAITRE